MNTIEDRLRDTFRAIDAQVAPPPLRDDVPAAPAVPRRVLVAAAAVLVAVVAGATVVGTRDTGREAVVADDVSAAGFDELAEPICARLVDERIGVYPRFATSEAYRLVAEQRAELVTSVLVSFGNLPNAEDDARLRDRVLHTLDEAEARATVVIDRADAGNVDGAAAAWPRVDQYIDLAMSLLAEHGAERCRP